MSHRGGMLQDRTVAVKTMVSHTFPTQACKHAPLCKAADVAHPFRQAAPANVLAPFLARLLHVTPAFAAALVSLSISTKHPQPLPAALLIMPPALLLLVTKATALPAPWGACCVSSCPMPHECPVTTQQPLTLTPTAVTRVTAVTLVLVLLVGCLKKSSSVTSFIPRSGAPAAAPPADPADVSCDSNSSNKDCSNAGQAGCICCERACIVHVLLCATAHNNAELCCMFYEGAGPVRNARGSGHGQMGAVTSVGTSDMQLLTCERLMG
jgi:hypothetical protein